MHHPLTLEVTTRLFGLGTPRDTTPVYLSLPTATTTARALIDAHVQAEVERAIDMRTGSLALHYLLDANVRAQPEASASALDSRTEIERAYTGLCERRFLLVVDGSSITELDAPLEVSERSVVSFVRLLPLIGG